MTRFSEYLEKIIVRSGMTENQLAKVSGFTRSYIALMRSGRRISADEEKMLRLMQNLNLSPLEQEQFREEYIRARIGDDVYERNEAVMDLIDSFNNTSNITIRSSWEYEIPNIKTISSRLDLEQIILMVIRKESMKKDGFVHIIMQGGDNFLGRVLPEVCRNNRELKIEHIVCIENSIENEAENYQLYNVNLLKEVVTTMVFTDNRNYQVYYYYDHVASRFNTGTLLSYMVLTSEYLVCMDSDMNHGTISKDDEVRDLYQCLFQKQKKSCQSLFVYMNTQMDILNRYISDERKENTTYSLAQQPCFGVLKVENYIKKYFLHNDSQVAYAMEEMIRKNRQNLMKEDQKHISYCSKEGLNRFVKEGVVDEIPRNLYTEISKKDRKIILTMLLKLIDEERYELYFVDEMISRIPKELFITIYDMSNIVILYLSEKKESRILMNENNMIRIIYEAFLNLPKSLKSSAKEDARNYLEELIRQI